jgi:hypothetical protein
VRWSILTTMSRMALAKRFLMILICPIFNSFYNFVFFQLILFLGALEIYCGFQGFQLLLFAVVTPLVFHCWNI